LVVNSCLSKAESGATRKYSERLRYAVQSGHRQERPGGP
jgi:hypothetical protein